MKRHIERSHDTLTLCGIFAPHRLLSEGEVGVAFDGCKVCLRLHQRELDREAAVRKMLADGDRAIAVADQLLAKLGPCCDGRCGAL